MSVYDIRTAEVFPDGGEDGEALVIRGGKATWEPIETPTPSITKPSIVSPTDGTYAVLTDASLTASDFVGIAGIEVHVSTDWQVATDSGFTALIIDSEADTTNKTSIAMTLSDDTIYYARVRYHGVGVSSEWSDTIGFSTTTTLAIGTKLSDGIVAGQLDGYWIICAMADKRAQKRYGVYGYDIPELWSPSMTAHRDPKTGEWNTDLLITNYSDYDDGTSIGVPAASYCRSLGPQWFFPCDKEAEVIATNHEAIDAADDSGGLGTLTYINSIWPHCMITSTEGFANYSRLVYVFAGITSAAGGHKHEEHWVIPCRKIAV